jgi:hypothetical protein
VPGYISDSRIVGDVLYAVTFEDGYCWDCQASRPNTTDHLARHRRLLSDDRHVVDSAHATTTTPTSYVGRRSIHVTEDRIYIGAVDWDAGTRAVSTIEVVDISDAGRRSWSRARACPRPGADLESRWQMDERDGVLRVISQPGMWETRRSTRWCRPSPSALVVEHHPARHDRPRAADARVAAQRCASTARGPTPSRPSRPTRCSSVDLTDPAQTPCSAAMLEMPGWVYHLEPRGDRLLRARLRQHEPRRQPRCTCRSSTSPTSTAPP